MASQHEIDLAAIDDDDDGLESDARMTAERAERKYVLPGEAARDLAAALTERLEPHRYRGKGANELPGARHYVTTIYFDTPSRDLFRSAEGSTINLKLRAKEYYDVHPALAELATDPGQLIRHRPVLWLEIKHRDGDRTGKQRIGLPKPEVPAFFGEGRITAEMIAIQEPRLGEASAEVLESIAALCRRFAQPLGADALVNYRRLAWQDPAGSVRITLDVGIAFYRPPADLWTGQRILLREHLGAPRAAEPRAVIEVKLRGAAPEWLSEILSRAGAAPADYSKFEQASRAVHG